MQALSCNRNTFEQYHSTMKSSSSLPASVVPSIRKLQKRILAMKHAEEGLMLTLCYIYSLWKPWQSRVYCSRASLMYLQLMQVWVLSQSHICSLSPLNNIKLPHQSELMSCERHRANVEYALSQALWRIASLHMNLFGSFVKFDL